MKRLLVIGAVSASMLVATGAIAYAAGVGHDRGAALPQSVLRHARPAVGVDSSTESKFTPIAPCRAVDTRSKNGGGAFVNNTTRSYSPETVCTDVPAAATAVTATITTVASNRGYLTAWAYDNPKPATSFMNYGTSFNTSSGGVIQLDVNHQIGVYNYGGPTQVIIDITGYYVAPMVADVNADGSLRFGPRVTSSSQVGTGLSRYLVYFDRSVNRCTFNVTPYGGTTGAFAYRGGDALVHVELFNTTDGSPALNEFFLTVTC